MQSQPLATEHNGARHSPRSESPREDRRGRTSSNAFELQQFLRILGYREPTMVFIDGANLYECAKAADIKTDFRAMWDFFATTTHFVRANYYTATADSGAQGAGGFDPLRPLVDWLKNNGYSLITKNVTEYTNDDGIRRKGDMDVELATDLTLLPFEAPDVKHVVLFTGDGDYCYPVARLKQRGVRVTCIAPGVEKGVTSRKLKETVDMFVRLEDFASHLAGTPPGR